MQAPGIHAGGAKAYAGSFLSMEIEDVHVGSGQVILYYTFIQVREAWENNQELLLPVLKVLAHVKQRPHRSGDIDK